MGLAAYSKGFDNLYSMGRRSSVGFIWDLVTTSMRLAFVLRLGNDSRPGSDFFEGWVEEVDSCTGMRFRSTEELLEFLGQRFDLTMGKTGSGDSDVAPTASKPPRTRKKSY